MVSIKILIAAVLLVLSFQNCSKIQTSNIGEMDAASLSLVPAGSCEYEGRTYKSGEGVLAYLNSSVDFGQTCISEKRTCVNGVMSGSYNFSKCVPGDPADCRYNGQTLAHGASVLTFQTSSVPYGSSCKQEARTCNNGTLSGSYNFPACEVGAPANCLFDGKVVVHGQEVASFQNSSVAYGETCVQQNRTCNNGVLSGSYNSPTCTAGAPASCSFNGQAIAHGQNVPAFLNSSVAYGETCVQQNRTCNNGALSGSYAYASCNVGAPASCLVNGQQIASGQSLRMFSTSTVAFGQSCHDEVRVCTNGSMSGSFGFASCAPEAPASCQFNGQNVSHGQTLQAFAASSVEFGQSCQQQTRTCSNGTLSGDYTFASCEVGAPKSCLFNGQTLAHQQSIVTYATSVVYDPATCQKETRVCNNGTLSGSLTSPTCSAYQQLTKTSNVTNSGSIDILIVMDNSISMEFEQQSMAARTSKFLEALQGLNYQIAITTTDPVNATYGDGNIVKLTGGTDYIITSAMPSTTAQTLLSNTLHRPESGSGYEQGIRATYRTIQRAIAGPKTNAGKLLRANTPFAALVISDEDEDLANSNDKTKNVPANLLSYINTAYSGSKPFSFHSIVTQTGDEACRTTNGVTYGATYEELSRLTGGVVGNVCATDYSDQVKAIADGVRKTAKTITLTCQPAVDGLNQIVVLKDGAVYTAAKSMVGMNLVFDDFLPNGQYTVKYNCLK